MYNFELNKTYSFNTQAPSILGASIDNAMLLATFGYETAKSYENIDLKYRNIYPLLPIGTPDSPESAIYYLFKSQSGEHIVIANLWIQESTITVVDNITFQVTFNNVGLNDITIVRDALNSLGYTQYTIKQI